MRVAGVGLSCIDIYEGEVNRSYPTGNSVDFVIHLSRLGLKTSMVGVVGNDEYGSQLSGKLWEEGVDISRLRVEEGRTAVFRMELKGNDRQHKEKIEGVMAGFALTEEDIAFICRHELMHTNYSGKVAHTLPLFRQRGLRTVFDFTIRVNREAGEVLPHVDYAFYSYDQDDSFIRDYMEWAQSLGPRIVVVTLGERGSLAYDGIRFYREGIVAVPVVNTVGAGDSFCAGFMHGIAAGLDVQQSLSKGAKLASDIVQKFEPY